tara:strand:+ start:334 stop:570 length:237 start_codon:yes stop_codon:yes gene_type:complete
MGDSGEEINQPMGIEIINHQMGYNTTEHRIFIEPNPDLFDSRLTYWLVMTRVNMYGGMEPMTAPQDTTPNIHEIDQIQ